MSYVFCTKCTSVSSDIGLQARRIRWARHVARKGERRTVYRVLWGDVRERRTRCRWEDIIKNGSARIWFVERGLDLPWLRIGSRRGML